MAGSAAPAEVLGVASSEGESKRRRKQRRPRADAPSDKPVITRPPRRRCGTWQDEDAGSARRPRAIDLFCGPGGLTRGLLDAKFDVVGAVEIDKLAADTYHDNFPEVTLWEGDIRQLSSDNMLGELARSGIHRGDLELLAGCPPCEGFSRMRTRNGNKEIEDDRNELIYEFARLVEDLLPHYVMLENVPALKADRRFADFLSTLERLGYGHTEGDVKNVAEYGVPQRRRRLILIAARRDVAALPLEPAKTGLSTVRSTISRLAPPDPKRPVDPLHDYADTRTKKVMQRIRSVPRDGGSRKDLDPDLVLDCHAKFAGFRDVYGRMAWDAPSPTITGGCVNPSKGRFLHPEQDRAITLREAALLQSFPHGHMFRMDGGKYRCAEMIGNALPPKFVQRHAEGICEMLRKRAEHSSCEQVEVVDRPDSTTSWESLAPGTDS